MQVKNKHVTIIAASDQDAEESVIYELLLQLGYSDHSVHIDRVPTGYVLTIVT